MPSETKQKHDHYKLILIFHKLDEIGNNGISGFTKWKQKKSATNYYL